MFWSLHELTVPSFLGSIGWHGELEGCCVHTNPRWARTNVSEARIRHDAATSGPKQSKEAARYRCCINGQALLSTKNFHQDIRPLLHPRGKILHDLICRPF